MRRARLSIRSIRSIVVRPVIMYPAYLRLSRRKDGSFAGKYGEDGRGTIFLSSENVRDMIREPWKAGGFISLIAN